MNLNKIRKKIEKETRSKVKIRYKEFPIGYWLNPINNDWVTTRVYITPTDKSNIPKILKKINNLNVELIKSNTQILITK